VPRARLEFASPAGRARALLVAAAFGMVAAGLTITTVGATAVFVPQDLEFIRASREELQAINAKLIPLIAHDRAGFGGALLCFGVATLFAVLHGPIRKSLRQALALAGVFGFSTAIGIHAAIGYLSLPHLAPAVFGCVVYFVGVALARAPEPAT